MLKQIDGLLGDAPGTEIWPLIPDGSFSIRNLQDQPVPNSSCLFQLASVFPLKWN